MPKSVPERENEYPQGTEYHIQTTVSRRLVSQLYGTFVNLD